MKARLLFFTLARRAGDRRDQCEDPDSIRIMCDLSGRFYLRRTLQTPGSAPRGEENLCRDGKWRAPQDCAGRR